MAVITYAITASDLTGEQLTSLMDWVENQTHITVDYGRVVRSEAGCSITVHPAYAGEVDSQQWAAFCAGFALNAE